MHVLLNVADIPAIAMLVFQKKKYPTFFNHDFSLSNGVLKKGFLDYLWKGKNHDPQPPWEGTAVAPFVFSVAPPLAAERMSHLGMHRNMWISYVYIYIYLYVYIYYMYNMCILSIHILHVQVATCSVYKYCDVEFWFHILMLELLGGFDPLEK